MKLTCILAAALLPGLLLAGCSKEDPKSYSKVDYNKDGKIIFEELIVVFPDLTVEEFLIADADNSGVLSEREYNRFRQARDAGKKLDASAPPLAPEPAKAAEPAKPAEPAKAAEPAKPTEPAPAPAAAPQTPAAPASQAPAEPVPAPVAPVPPTPAPVAEAVEMVVAEATPTKAPAPAAATSYTVARGDNLVRIAKKFGLTTQELMAANGIKDADRLEAGKVLTIPGQSGPAAASSEVKPAVAAFVADYFAKSSAADVTALVDLYGESVDYYKKGKAGSDVVRQDKAAYFERWPERSYKTAAPTVAELPGGDVKVTIPVDYVVKRAEKSVRGKATFTLLLRPAGGSYRIIGEQSAVLEHK